MDNNIVITFTNEEIHMLWCEALQNMEYWRDSVFIHGNKNDLFMYHIARSAYSKIHKGIPNGIIHKIKNYTKKKYSLKIKRIKEGEF